MKEVIAPIDKDILKAELTQKHFLRPTNKANNELYEFSSHECPNLMREVGRLRELAFRSGGGGTGEEVDIDDYDIMEKPYRQLIVWDPEKEEIVGGYRYLKGTDTTMHNGQPNFVSGHMFHFSEKFCNEYLEHTIELGRAFVQPKYQTALMGMKSLFALDNLWDGLGAIIHKNKNVNYLIGKVTIYREYNALARDLLYTFLERYFPDNEGLITPDEPMVISKEAIEIGDRIFSGDDKAANYKILQKEARSIGENVPAMFNAYIGLSTTMKTFGSGINHEFGEVYETGIMVTISDLLEEKRKRYILPYINYLKILRQHRQRIRKKARIQKRDKRRNKE
ncbi:MAG: GNAT family N-acetyltransferase [Paludibacteraceae bacterium]|nr:GNAT family N-acetyltransferase [Paludibacteraceae bacterium]